MTNTVKVYAIIDKVAETIRAVNLAENDRSAVANIVFSGIGNRFPYRDLEIKCVAEIETKTGRVHANSKLKTIPWDIYSAPVDERENLETLGKATIEAYDEMKAKEKKEEEVEKDNKEETKDL